MTSDEKLVLTDYYITRLQSKKFPPCSSGMSEDSARKFIRLVRNYVTELENLLSDFENMLETKPERKGK